MLHESQAETRWLLESSLDVLYLPATSFDCKITTSGQFLSARVELVWIASQDILMIGVYLSRLKERLIFMSHIVYFLFLRKSSIKPFTASHHVDTRVLHSFHYSRWLLFSSFKRPAGNWIRSYELLLALSRRLTACEPASHFISDEPCLGIVRFEINEP